MELHFACKILRNCGIAGGLKFKGKEDSAFCKSKK